MLKGIDISEHQGVIDYEKVRQQVDFVIVRASYSDTIVDRQGWNNRTHMRWQAAEIGHYHYAEPGQSPAPVQARAFLDSVGWIVNGEPFILDIEVDHNNLEAWAWRWCQIVYNVTGKPPVLYTSPDFLNRYGFARLFEMGCPLWLASWGIEPGYSAGHGHWNHNVIHQYTSEGHVNGIIGNVDMDTFDGTIEDWRALGASL